MFESYLFWGIVILCLLAVALIVIDAFWFRIPGVRQVRVVAGAIVVLLLALIGLDIARRDEPAPRKPKRHEPDQFDDTEHGELDAKADDTDVDAAGSDRDLDELDDSNAGLRRRLDEL